MHLLSVSHVRHRFFVCATSGELTGLTELVVERNHELSPSSLTAANLALVECL